MKKNEESTKIKRKTIAKLYLHKKLEGAKFVYMDELNQINKNVLIELTNTI